MIVKWNKNFWFSIWICALNFIYYYLLKKDVKTTKIFFFFLLYSYKAMHLNSSNSPLFGKFYPKWPIFIPLKINEYLILLQILWIIFLQNSVCIASFKDFQNLVSYTSENLLKQHKSEKGAPAGNGGVEKFKRTFL